MTTCYDLTCDEWGTRKSRDARGYLNKILGLIKNNRYWLILCLFLFTLIVLYSIPDIKEAYKEKDFSEFTYPREIRNFNELISKLDEATQDKPTRVRRSLHDQTTYETIVRALGDEKQGLNVYNVTPFEQFNNLEFTIQPLESCAHAFKDSSKQPTADDGSPISIVMVVKSAVNNFIPRQAIRDSWYLNGRHGLFDFKTVFMVGACHENNPVPASLRSSPDRKWTPIECEAAIANESQKYGDLIQSSGIDSYYNNTIKTVMILKWVSEHCRASDYFLAIDDDFVFEEKNFRKHLEEYALAEYYNPSGNVSLITSKENMDSALALTKLSQGFVYMGYMHNYVRPRRSGKWSISLEEYPYNKYPRFMTGGHILMSHKTVRHFYLATFFTQMFKFDDVYLGIIAHKLNVQPQESEEFMCTLSEYLSQISISPSATICIGVHEIPPKDLVDLWKERKS